MKLLEHEGKELFNKGKIRIPKGIVVSSQKDFKKIFAPAVVKAQVLRGKRGKAGLIKVGETKNEVKDIVQTFLKKKGVFSVLLEKKVTIEKEYYLSLMVDGGTKSVIGIFSKKGGMDIEEVSQKYPQEIVKFQLNKKEIAKKVKVPERKEIEAIIFKLLDVMKKHDCELVEINPLAITKKGVVALDSKVVIDEKSLYRQQQFAPLERRELKGIELKAAKHGLHYVDLDGDIGVIGDGAGLVMATLDVLQYYKAKPTNFLDVGGGAGEKRMKKALQLILQKKPKGLLVNIFGGITHCDEIARAIIHIRKKIKLKTPLVVRMAGTNEKEGISMLKKEGVEIARTMEEGVRKLKKRLK